MKSEKQNGIGTEIVDLLEGGKEEICSRLHFSYRKKYKFYYKKFEAAKNHLTDNDDKMIPF